MNRLLALLAASLILLSAATSFAQRELKDIPDPDPELEQKTFQVAEGFEVNLFAADPLIAKPIQMNFDAQGRLWIASSEVYPQIAPGAEANDRILVVEDVDGDGTAEKTTVFAKGLLIPTAVEPGDGGAYVANSTELIHLRDTDGDGAADQRRIVLSGFGTEDTHHILHTFRWGYDGMLYFNQSIYIHSHLETPHGVRRLNGGGIWQLRPETMQAEVTARGFVNTWGHHYDRFGAEFATDGAYGEGINYLVPGAAYVTAVGVPRILKGMNPGSPKHCGLEIVSGRHLPDDWQGNAITNDFRGHRVSRFVLSEDGSGFASREQTDLIRSTHVAFRPIDVKMGPDGAIYIADWYNPIIQHGEVDFRDPRRDHVHGRIWRVTAKGRPLVERPQLVDATTEQLFAALTVPEDWTRTQAKRVLKGRGPEILTPLAAWWKGLDAADPEVEHHRLEALWTYQSLDVVEPELLGLLLQAQDPRVRAAATRVIGYWATRLPNPLALLADQVADEHPRVRLEAVRALARIPQVRSMELAVTVLDRPLDQYLDYALWLTARDLQPIWLPELLAGRLNFGGNARQLTFALQAAGAPGVVKPLIALLQQGEIAADRQEGILSLVGALGEPDDLSVLFQLAVTRGDTQILAILEEAARQRQVKPTGDLSGLLTFLASEDEPGRQLALRLVGLWKIEQLRPALTVPAQAPETEAMERIAALDGLVALGGPKSEEFLKELAAEPHPLAQRLLAAAALAGLNVEVGAEQAVLVLGQLGAEQNPAPLVEAFLSQKEGPAALTAALANAKLPEDVAKVAVRTVRSSARQEPALADALAAAGGITTGAKMLTAEEMTQMVADVQMLGNAQRGEALFRRNDLACFRCHAIGGSGGQVGPDLVSLGASAQIDYLIDSLLLPSKQVKENYHSLVVTTDAGKIFTGIKVAQTDKNLVLRDAEDRTVEIPLDLIDEQVAGASMMPVGLIDTLTRGEMLDLVRFLSELGKVGPFAVSKTRFVRRWQVLADSPAAARRLKVISPEQLAVPHPAFVWESVYSRVGGDLTVEGLPVIEEHRTLLRFELDVTTPGDVKLVFNSVEGLTAGIAGKQVPLARETLVSLEAGVQTIFVVVDPEVRKEPLQVELADQPGSPAQVQIVGGK